MFKLISYREDVKPEPEEDVYCGCLTGLFMWMTSCCRNPASVYAEETPPELKGFELLQQLYFNADTTPLFQPFALPPILNGVMYNPFNSELMSHIMFGMIDYTDVCSGSEATIYKCKLDPPYQQSHPALPAQFRLKVTKKPIDYEEESRVADRFLQGIDDASADEMLPRIKPLLNYQRFADIHAYLHAVQETLNTNEGLCMTLSHPNILKCYGFSFLHNHGRLSVDGHFRLADTLISKSLSRGIYTAFLLEDCPKGALSDNKEEFLSLDVKTRCQKYTDLIKCLRFLHEDRETAHHDIKPENILVTESMDLKFADFGSAAVRRSGERSSGFTAFYLPADTMIRNPADFRFDSLDIWALAVTILNIEMSPTPLNSIISRRELRALANLGEKALSRSLLDFVPKFDLPYLSRSFRHTLAQMLTIGSFERPTLANILESKPPKKCGCFC